MEHKLLTIALFSSAIGACQKAVAQTHGTNTDKPNVIIILADDLGYGDLECYGAKNVQTPNPSLTGKNIFHKYSGCFV